MDERLWTVRQLADELGLGERTIRDRLNRGEIRGHKAGGRGKWMIRQSEVDRLLGRGEAEALSGVAARLRDQLYTPPPEAVLLRDFGSLGTHIAPLEHRSLDVLWRDLGYDAGVRASVTSTGRVLGEGRQICWRVLGDGALEMCCPLETEPSFESKLLSIDGAVKDRLAAWKKEGGGYLAGCSQVLVQIHDDAKTRTGVRPVEDLIRKLPKLGPTPPPPLTPHFGDLVYQLAIQYRRSSGARGLPDRRLYQTRYRDLLFSDLVLGQACIHLATALHGVVGNWADIHRQMIIQWGKSGSISTLWQLFDRLQGMEKAIRVELDRVTQGGR